MLDTAPATPVQMINDKVAQLVRALVSYAGCRGFESRPCHQM